MAVAVQPTLVIERLHAAINRHDIEALMECFAPHVRNELPTRPERGFSGRDELRAYWEQVIGGPGTFRAELLRCCAGGSEAWAEWCWHGERADGSPFARAGVTIYGVEDDRIAWMRLYMEPVQGDAETVGAFLARELGGSQP